MRTLVLGLAVATGLVWTVALTPSGVRLEDRTCPARQVRVRYPAYMADFIDGNGSYRIAYCKPTGIPWDRLNRKDI